MRCNLYNSVTTLRKCDEVVLSMPDTADRWFISAKSDSRQTVIPLWPRGLRGGQRVSGPVL